MSPSKESPIGILDSGVGGLAVARSLMNSMPDEHVIYYGDTARAYFGIKSVDCIRQFALQMVEFLLKKKVKTLLISSNSIAASAGIDIRKRCRHIPAIDVVEAGCREALQRINGSRRIGVIGTLATIGSGAHERIIGELDKTAQVFSRACPLLVPLAEEGWTENHIAREILELYLTDIKDKKPDALILGCTHYSLFRKYIQQIMGDNVVLVDPTDAIAVMTREHLKKSRKLRKGERGTFDCYISDKPQRFKIMAERFLGQKLSRMEIVHLKV